MEPAPSAKQRAVLDDYVRLGCNAVRLDRESDHSSRNARRLAKQYPEYVREVQREYKQERRDADRALEDRARAARADRDVWCDELEPVFREAVLDLMRHDDPRLKLAGARLFSKLRSTPTAGDSQVSDPEIDALVREFISRGDDDHP